MRADLSALLKGALERIADRTGSSEEKAKAVAASDIDRLVTESAQPLELILAEATVLAARAARPRPTRDSLEFETSSPPATALVYTRSSTVSWALDPATVEKCVISANETLSLFHDLSMTYGVGLYQLLGLRNLSSFVGEVFGKELIRAHSDRLMANPNQDGYPDLCALTPEGRKYVHEKCRSSDGSLRTDKTLWSPFPYGGIEVKATCGNTPSASKVPKPGIGQKRLPIVVSAEWKAHHQETQTLLGLFWDFIDEIPTVLAAFFRNDLDPRVGSENPDWGRIIQPKEGKGHTTSVSIMKRNGVAKMGSGWLVLPNDQKLRKSIEWIFDIDPEASTLSRQKKLSDS